MYVIDMSSLKKEGEFGSRAWGEKLALLPLSKF